MKNSIPFRLLLFCMLALASRPIAAQSDIRTESVVFPAGKTETTIQGTIKGRQTIDYTLAAKAGQKIRIDLETKHDANYFNLLPPGSDNVAVYIGQIEGNHFAGTLEKDGTYKIRVYLMPSAARRNETAAYTLHVGITGG